MDGKVICFRDKGKAVCETCAVSEPKPGEVLIESEYTVVSAGTERANLIALPNTGTGPGGYDGKHDGGFPFCPGYCGVGRIVKLGDGVEGFTPGDRVLADHAGHRSHFLKPAGSLTRVPAGVEPLEAAFTVIAAMSLQGVRKARIELGEAVLVEGLGLLGIFATQLAKLSGAIPVIVTDFDEARRKLALQLGADFAFSPDDPELSAKVREATGGHGVDAVIEVTGAASALVQALECAAFRGRVVLLGCTRVSDAPVDYYRDVHKTGVSIIGAHNSVRPKEDSSPGFRTYRDDFRTLLALAGAKRFRAAAVISELVPPEKAPEIYRRLAECANPPLGIVFDWTGRRA